MKELLKKSFFIILILTMFLFGCVTQTDNNILDNNIVLDQNNSTKISSAESIILVNDELLLSENVEYSSNLKIFFNEVNGFLEDEQGFVYPRMSLKILDSENNEVLGSNDLINNDAITPELAKTLSATIKIGFPMKLNEDYKIIFNIWDEKNINENNKIVFEKKFKIIESSEIIKTNLIISVETTSLSFKGNSIKFNDVEADSNTVRVESKILFTIKGLNNFVVEDGKIFVGHSAKIILPNGETQVLSENFLSDYNKGLLLEEITSDTNYYQLNALDFYWIPNKELTNETITLVSRVWDMIGNGEIISTIPLKLR